MSFLRAAIRPGQARQGDPADDVQCAAGDHVEQLHPCHPWDSTEPEPAGSVPPNRYRSSPFRCELNQLDHSDLRVASLVMAKLGLPALADHLLGMCSVETTPRESSAVVASSKLTSGRTYG